MPDFAVFFERCTGNPPFPYQARLATAPLPDLLDVPTGLGKTAAVVMAWLYKRLQAETCSRRLVYCLPMRTLVQQTVDSTRAWLERAAPAFAAAGRPLPTCHVLMGGENDDTWDTLPESPAILIGTQDMLLSRALNRGYGMSRFRWPMHYAWVNNDALWVYDETQLMGVAVETGAQLDGLRRTLGTFGSGGSLWMSATLGREQLATIDHPEPAGGWSTLRLTASDHDAAVVRQRVGAKKALAPVEGVRVLKESDSDATKALTEQVLAHHQPDTLTLVVLNRVSRAQALYDALGKALAKDPSAPALALVHSRFRAGDRAAHERTLHAPGSRIVVATQAVEAGVDVSAATLFSELAPWSSLVQRFGRCNRYGERDDARIFWVDIDEEGSRGNTALPYTPAELVEARAMLAELVDAGPSTLAAVSYRPPVVVRPVLRRKDIVELFDTSSELSGDDIDVSRYIRDGDDVDVQFAWRDFALTPDEQPLPQREELCSVGIGAAKGMLKTLHEKRATGEHSHSQAWRWDPLEASWRALREWRVRPGDVLLLHPAAGGYDTQLGWTGQAGKGGVTPTSPTSTANGRSRAAMNADGETQIGRWVPLSEHTGDVREVVEGLSDQQRLPAPWSQALRDAAAWHDVGKAHWAFQEMLTAPGHENAALAPPGEGPWAKSNHQKGRMKARPMFRHELASALAWLQLAEGAPQHDLVAFLIAAHHGKVRLALRAVPGEREANDGLFARGVWDGDRLESFTLCTGETYGPVTLDLSPMTLGPGSWQERMVALRDDAALGPFRLSYLEATLRSADARASHAEAQGGTL